MTIRLRGLGPAVLYLQQESGRMVPIGTVDKLETEMDTESNATFNRGVKQGEKSSALALARELDGKDAVGTEQIVYDWLRSRGVHVSISGERWVLG